MKIEYDKIADSMYMFLSKKEIVKTVPINESIILDIDAQGSLVGIELIGVSSQISKKALQESIKTGVPVFA